MADTTDEHLRYPIGRYAPPEVITIEKREEWIEQIATLPQRFIPLAKSLTEKQLNTPYREGGWTARQVIHHVPDSHLNCYVRFKWALTEDNPLIKAYNEADWSELNDSKSHPIQPSLDLLEAVHSKLVILLRGMFPADFQRTFVHPESGNQLPLSWYLGQYAWHGNHHLGHLEIIRNRAV